MTLSPWPFFNIDQQEIVKNILISGNVNYLYGNEGKTFEKEFSRFLILFQGLIGKSNILKNQLIF